jgi:hypothetical protein
MIIYKVGVMKMNKKSEPLGLARILSEGTVMLRPAEPTRTTCLPFLS